MKEVVNDELKKTKNYEVSDVTKKEATDTKKEAN